MAVAHQDEGVREQAKDSEPKTDELETDIWLDAGIARVIERHAAKKVEPPPSSCHSLIALGDDVWFDRATQRELPIQERCVAYVFQSLALSRTRPLARTRPTAWRAADRRTMGPRAAEAVAGEQPAASLSYRVKGAALGRPWPAP